MATPDTSSGQRAIPEGAGPGADSRTRRLSVAGFLGSHRQEAGADRLWLARHRFLVPGFVLVALLLVWAGWRAERAWSAYQDAKTSIHELETLRETKLSAISTADVEQANVSVDKLGDQLRQLQSAITPPFGTSLIDQIPWAGSRYRNGQRAIQMGIDLTNAGKLALPAGNGVLTAFSSTGAGKAVAANEPTWLSTLWTNRAAFNQAVNDLNQAAQIRATLDPAVLPGSVRDKLPQLDKLFQRCGELGSLVNHDLPGMYAALGGSSPQRYLVLFQNSDEMRLSGGFPGTVALITVSRGQLVSYQFDDVYNLQKAYAASDAPPVEQPYPLAHYFAPNRPLQIQDASWGADFAQDGQLLMSMYKYTGYPSINGVIAVTPSVVSQLIEATGPLTIDLNGASTKVTPDNVQQLIEEERHVNSDQPDVHKEAVALIGEQLLARLRSGNRSELTSIARNLKQLANSRDIQLYSADPNVESLLDSRHWSGRMLPDPKTPTIAVNVASTIPNKASQTIQTSMALDVSKPANGRQQVELALTFHHTGQAGQQYYYYGAQRWWVEVRLPSGSKLASASVSAAPDPEAPNGGSYVITLNPGTTQHLTISFSMPESSSLLLRRQPGVNDFWVAANLPGCAKSDDFALSRDTTLRLDGVCE